MTSFALLAVLTCALRAQTQPALPSAPAQQPDAAAAAAAPARLDTVARRFSVEELLQQVSWKDVETERLRRGLVPAAHGASYDPLQDPDRLNDGTRSDFTQRRQTVETVDIPISRPVRRVELGAGWSETTVYAGHLRLNRYDEEHLFLRLDLSRRAPPPRALVPLSGAHTSVESGSVTRVRQDETSLRDLKRR